MTQPTFQELLTSQEARDRVEKFYLDPFKGEFWMCNKGYLYRLGDIASPTRKHPIAVWQGWLTEAEPPPEPRVFKAVRYFNFYQSGGVSLFGWPTREGADTNVERGDERLACVRVEITATEGQFDD